MLWATTINPGERKPHVRRMATSLKSVHVAESQVTEKSFLPRAILMANGSSIKSRHVPKQDPDIRFALVVVMLSPKRLML